MQNEINSKQLYVIRSKGLPIKTKWRLIWLKSKELSPIAKAYLEYIKTEKAKVIENNFQWYVDFKFKK
jgi:hypothetical protein